MGSSYLGLHSPPATIMSNHLKLLISLMVVFETSYAAFLPTSFLSQPGTGDIVQQARTQADALKKTLRSLARKPEAAPIFEKVFAGNNSDCINNMDQALEAIETSATLFENAGTEIKLLILDVLIPKLTPSSICQTKSGDVLNSMNSLGALVNELSSKEDVYYTTHGRQTLKTSAKILSKVTKFLTKESHFKFDHFCTKDKAYNKEFIGSVGNMMNDLADLYTGLGGVTAASELARQETFTKKVVANINKFGDLDLISLDCNTPGSSQLVADTLEDLAGVIEDVGLVNLCKQVGLASADCQF